jgi:two-component system chemotaxis response regulator CheB
VNRPPRQARVEAPEGISAVAFASSTGGPNALKEIFGLMPADFPLPIVIAQHVAEGFEDGLARWLGQTCPLRFRVADEGVTPLVAGEVVLGRSGWDVIYKNPDEVSLRVAPKRGYHPSGDALFESAARVFGPKVLAVVLSGIGSDGTAGAAAISKVAGTVMAQDERSCVVYGMPRSVVDAGLASLVGSPQELGHAILNSAGPERVRGGNLVRTIRR